MNRMQGRRFLMKMAAPLLALTLFLAQGGEAYAADRVGCGGTAGTAHRIQ